MQMRASLHMPPDRLSLNKDYAEAAAVCMATQRDTGDGG